jgi:hypothetical protein
MSRTVQDCPQNVRACPKKSALRGEEKRGEEKRGEERIRKTQRWF